MAECIDAEAREMAAKAQRFAGEIGAALWGDHVLRDNGVRSQVRRHEDRLDTIEGDQRNLRGDLRHYLDSERAATCIGKVAVDELEDRIKTSRETSEKLMVEMRKARYAMLTGLGVGLLAAASPIVLELVKK